MVPLVAEEAEASTLPAFIATKSHGLFYLLLAFNFFCLPLCLAFGVSPATLSLLRFSLSDIYLLDLFFDRRLDFFPRLYLRWRWRLRRGSNLWRRLRGLRCLCGGGQDYSGWHWRS
jgi:hypothetical protein